MTARPTRRLFRPTATGPAPKGAAAGCAARMASDAAHGTGGVRGVQWGQGVPLHPARQAIRRLGARACEAGRINAVPAALLPKSQQAGRR